MFLLTMLKKGAGNVLQLSLSQTHTHTRASRVKNMFNAHGSSAGETEGPIS
jgi:hypothetical protein